MTAEDVAEVNAMKKVKRSQKSIAVLQGKYKDRKSCVYNSLIKIIFFQHFISAPKSLFITDGTDKALNGYCMYFLRTNTKRTLGEETFQVLDHLLCSFS